jgi:serine/threonine protein kinase
VSEQVKMNEDAVLGAGTFGKVLAGFHQAWGRMVAVKSISIAQTGSRVKFDQRLDSAVAEMLVAEMLPRNEHIITVHFYHDEACMAMYGIMPWCEASLDKMIKGTAILLDGTSGTRLSSHIMSGVRHMHAGGVIHGDLSMKNILIHQGLNGMVARVSDFGGASIVSGWKGQQPTPREDIRGVPGPTCSYTYAAPETLDINRKWCGFPKDDWSGAKFVSLALPGDFGLRCL